MKPELLAPAGSMAALKAAVEAGADAVYLGARQFNARTSADNFDNADLPQAIDYCHKRGVPVYFAVNTLYSDAELPEVLTLAKFALEEGADALIVQDLGFASAIKRICPDAVLHASTQMTVQTAEDAAFLRSHGFSRAVLARELTMAEIRETASGGLETEVFVHGAMCMGYSGQCLLSWHIGGRSGNRGECAQPCRLAFSCGGQHGHLLSPKDLMALELVPQLAALGVKALKIEGRAKSAEYVYIATRAYRNALDNRLTDTDKSDLQQIFNRGFSTGFLQTAKLGRGSMNTENPGHIGTAAGVVIRSTQKRCTIKASTPLNPGDGLVIFGKNRNATGTNVTARVEKGAFFSFNLKNGAPKPITGAAVYRNFNKELDRRTKTLLAQDTRTIKAEARAEITQNFSSITLRYTRPDGKIIAVKAEGAPPEQAKDRPLTRAEAEKRLAKTGGSGVKFEFTEIKVSEGLFMPVSALNQLRRNVAHNLLEAAAQSYKRKGLKNPEPIRPPATIAATRQNKIAIHAVIPKELAAAISNYTEQQIEIKRIYVEAALLAENPQIFLDICGNIPLYAALPLVGKCPVPLAELPVSGFLIRTWGQIKATQKLAQTGKTRVLDYSLHVYNSPAMQVLSEYGIPTVHPESGFAESNFAEDNPAEINLAEANFAEINFAPLSGEYEIPEESVPLLISRRCLKNLYGGCGNLGVITDRKGAEYTIISGCETGWDCHSRILAKNAALQYNQTRKIVERSVTNEKNNEKNN